MWKVMEMMWWYGPGMNAWGYTAMTVSMVLFWTLVIVGVVALVRYRGKQDTTARPTPEELLAERYARGEIDEAEYHQRLDVLTHGPRPLARP
jgi:putative membrane protein